MKEIKGFFKKYRFLSNFCYCDEVKLGNLKFNTVENAFQAAKTLDVEERKKFQNISPKEAKALGRRVKLRPDWEEIKDDIMQFLVDQKFRKDEDLKLQLLKTEEAYLEETNNWGDRYWGVDKIGENKLGWILMKVRKKLKRREIRYDKET